MNRSLVAAIVTVLALLLHESWAVAVSDDDRAVGIALDDLSVRAGDVDLIALASLSTVEQFDGLGRTVDALLDQTARVAALPLDASVQSKVTDFQSLLSDRLMKIDALKAARGRLANVEHYLPGRLEELARVHPDDGDIVRLRTLLLAYLLDPSTEHLHAVQAFTDNLKSQSDRPLFELYRQLDVFQKTKTELLMTGDDLERDLRRKCDDGVRAQAVITAAHQRRAVWTRLIGLSALLAIALAVGWRRTRR